jgi:hypothetical protein
MVPHKIRSDLQHKFQSKSVLGPLFVTFMLLDCFLEQRTWWQVAAGSNEKSLFTTQDH